jgi:hypothetical protein
LAFRIAGRAIDHRASRCKPALLTIGESPPKPIPGATADDFLIAWTADPKVVYAAGKGPVPAVGHAGWKQDDVRAAETVFDALPNREHTESMK